MSKIIVTTIGTSLYESASWNYDPHNPPPFLIPEYAEWVTKTDLLNSPSKRKTQVYSGKLINHIKTTFENMDPEQIKTNVIPYLADYRSEQEMRYSAELGAVLKYSYSLNREDWKEALSQYDMVVLYDDDDKSSKACAHHFKYSLKKLNAINVNLRPIEYFSSTNNAELQYAINKMGEYLEEIIRDQNNQEIILNTNGGYKIYGYYGFRYANSVRVKTIYWHETANKLLVMHVDANNQTQIYDPYAMGR
jgi:hypothetical protein